MFMREELQNLEPRLEEAIYIWTHMFSRYIPNDWIAAWHWNSVRTLKVSTARGSSYISEKFER